MSDFIASNDQALLERHGLGGFEALWGLQLDAVDEPNTARGGWSSVFRLELEGKGFYLKRQSNYLTHTLHRPFGEPTFGREFRNIRRYHELGIPSLDAVYYGQRRVGGQWQALLMTRALDGWTDLDSLLQQWPKLSDKQHWAIVVACGQLARTLHSAGQVHGCFYPKHIFLRERSDTWQAQLIDLEKTRPVVFGQRDKIKDLEPLLRRAGAWGESDVRVMLATYLQKSQESPLVERWLSRLLRRRTHKESR